MSVTITDRQFERVFWYLSRLRDGEVHDITESRRHHGELSELIAGMNEAAPIHRENDEAVIRANLRLWANIGTGP